MSNDNPNIVGAPPDRGQWKSRRGFILAASGRAVGLGNIWKFPYITGENGGGIFVLIYLVCIALVGLPIMIAEVMIGRATQRSPVPAFTQLSGGKFVWSLVGWMGVATGFILLSYYSVVAGWAFKYIELAASGAFSGASPEQIGGMFGKTAGSVGGSVFWHLLFMVATVAIVMGGVQKGIEQASKVMMPALLIILLILLVDAFTQPGFGKAASFVFSPNTDKLTAGGVLEALGHSFFTLSLGMGALITYGSYLSKKDDIVVASGTISLVDTAVALMACMVMFPIVFSVPGGEPGGELALGGPGLVFNSMPIAFSQMSGGFYLGLIFFILLLFAALTSAISLLEVCVATVIDQLGWERRRATVVLGTAIFAFGIPSAASGADWLSWWSDIFDKGVFDSMDYMVSNVLLPIGGLLIAVFVGWVMPASFSREQYMQGTKLGGTYGPWIGILRYFVPIAIMIVFLFKVGLIPEGWLK